MICEDLRELELYERAASEVRETMRILILPGREPPSASSDPAPLPVIPSVSDSQLLPTDPVAIVYPNKTLESVPTTAVIGGLPTEERKEQRSEDARYCARNLAGHVVLSQLDVVLARLGSPVLIDKLTELESVARTQINPQLRKDVLDKFRKESVPSLKPADRAIDGRYWLSRLADVCFASQSMSCTR
ncbi:hypothetical protein B0H11DRAFT_2067365 [Mycena galericulata]|nr:hypothetical protein B0H11DRAFT_2067365 [Mycena galericulata]